MQLPCLTSKLINYKPGKTQPIISYRGRGSKEYRVELNNKGNKIHIQYRNRIIAISVAQSYKHLGIMTVADLSMGPELGQRRKWLTVNATANLRKTLKDPKIPSERRRYLLMALLLTAIWYGASTWTALTVMEQYSLHVLVMRAYRYLVPAQIVGSRHMQKTDLQILSETAMPLPSII